MKTKHQLCFLFALLIFAKAANAQTTSIPYQAVARDSFNTPLPERNISLRFSIREGSSGGTVLYKETDTVATNKLGLFTSNIGEGHPVTGTFASIAWASGRKFLQVEADAAGGTSYVDMGTSELKSVPFSLRAESADNVVGVPANRIPYATSTGLTSDPCFKREGPEGNTRIGVKKGANYYALMLGDSNTVDIGGSPVNLPSATLYYYDTAHTYSMAMGVGKIPSYGLNQVGFLNLSMANGHYAGVSFTEQGGNPQVLAGASKYGSYSGIGSALNLEYNRSRLIWRHSNKNVHGIDADSLTLKIYSSLDTSQRYWTWPNTEGTNGQALVTNGSGTLSWASTGASSSWSLTGNSGTDSTTNFIGTTDAKPLVVKTNNTERVRVSSNGFVGIGTAAPLTFLHLQASAVNTYTYPNSANNQFLIKTLNNSGVANQYAGFTYQVSSDNNNNNAIGTIGVVQPTAGSTAGDLVFFTRLSSGAITEKLRITSDGKVGIGTPSPAKALDVSGDISLKTAGNGIYIKEGTNATMGTATLSSGTVTVSTTKVTANSRIFITLQGCTNCGIQYISARTAGTGFTVTSTSGTDASTITWLIVEPN